jgi:hypothetical protein
MAGNARFHNKLHRRNHHSEPSVGYPDSGSDPIASLEEPFLGDFYLTGSLSASKNLTVDGNTFIKGNLSALGDISYINTIVTVTSALSVINDGTGPAFTVVQNGAQPIARFLDADGSGGQRTALFIENNGQVVINGSSPAASRVLTIYGATSASASLELTSLSATGGNSYFQDSVGIGTPWPLEKLTVLGNISARNTVMADSLSANYLGLVHNPANNNVNPVVQIGETGSDGFSGVFISYNETTNIFGLSGLYSPAKAFDVVAIDRSGNVGIGGNSNGEKLTVVGSISSSNTVIGNTLCGRFIELVHTPANDSQDPYLRIGEGGTGVPTFSGYTLVYNEGSNSLSLSSVGFNRSRRAVQIDSEGNTVINLLTAFSPNYNNLNTDTRAPLSGSALASDVLYSQINSRVGFNTVPVSSYALHVRGGNIRVDGVDYSGAPGFDGTIYDSDGQSLFDLRSARLSANYSLSISESGLGHFMKFFGGRTGDVNPFVAVRKGAPIRFAQFNNFYGQGFAEIARIGGNSNVSIGLSADGSERLTVLGNISASGSTNTSDVSTRNISMIHTLANDGANPVFRIGELASSTSFSTFSGFFLEYNENLNVLSLSSVFTAAPGNTVLNINRNGLVSLFGSLSVQGSISNNEFEFVRAMPADSSVYSVVSTGVWVSNNFNSITTVTCNTQDLFLTPLWIPTDCTVLSAGVLAGTGSVNPADIRVAIYDAAIDGRPSALIGNNITISTGVVVPGAGDFMLGPAGFNIKRGNYYAGVMAKTNSAVLQTTFAGNIAKTSGQLNFSGINRLLPAIKDQEGGHLIVGINSPNNPPASLISLPIDFTSAGGAGVTTRVKFRQSAPFVSFRISTG